MKLPETAPDDGRHTVPYLVVFLGLHCAVGVALGISFAAILLMLDVAGLRGLIDTADTPGVAIAMLYIMCSLTFASVTMGIGVMALPKGDPDRRTDV